MSNDQAERAQASYSVFLFDRFEKLSSPYINQFLSADTIVPGYANPQYLNRYSYVTNNPLRYTDPTGHMRIQDGPQQDRFSQSVADRYRPRPRRSGHDGAGDQGTLETPNINIPINSGSMCNGNFVGSACFYGSTNATLISQGTSITFSPSLSISIGPYSFSPTSFGYGNSSISPNGDTTSQYTIASSNVYSVNVSTTFNLDKVKMAAQVTTNLNNGTIKGSTTLGVSGEIGPKRAAGAAGAGALLVAVAVIPGPIDDGLVIGGGYKLCRDAGLCP